MLYSRYGAGARDILLLPFEDGMDVLLTAQKQKAEEDLFFRWCNGIQHEMSFDEFKNKIGHSPDLNNNDSEEDALASVRAIMG